MKCDDGQGALCESWRLMTTTHNTQHTTCFDRLRWLGLVCFALCLVALLTACGADTTTTQTPAPDSPAVNGFGGSANHVHSLIALPGHVLVLATHYGIFRSADAGSTWQKTAAGHGQLMEGLMAFALRPSPLDSQRLFVLTNLAVVPHPGVLGLYTSADQGRIWQLSISADSLHTSYIFTEAAGNDSPDEVYIYVLNLGAQGLLVSKDDGQHFASVGTLPFGSVFGMLVLPGVPGSLLIYGGDGAALTTDGGKRWQTLKGITGGINEMVTAGPHTPIYASGDAGMYASLDGGKNFSLVYSQASYNGLTVAPSRPTVLYGETAQGVYRSADGGHSWSALPHISGNLANMAVDPADPFHLYLSLSFPVAVYSLQNNAATWQSLTPPLSHA